MPGTVLSYELSLDAAEDARRDKTPVYHSNAQPSSIWLPRHPLIHQYEFIVNTRAVQTSMSTFNTPHRADYWATYSCCSLAYSTPATMNNQPSRISVRFCFNDIGVVNGRPMHHFCCRIKAQHRPRARLPTHLAKPSCHRSGATHIAYTRRSIRSNVWSKFLFEWKDTVEEQWLSIPFRVGDGGQRCTPNFRTPKLEPLQTV